MLGKLLRLRVGAIVGLYGPPGGPDCKAKRNDSEQQANDGENVEREFVEAGLGLFLNRATLGDEPLGFFGGNVGCAAF